MTPRPCCAPGSPGSGSASGRVWGVHLAYSGNQVVSAEHSPTGWRLLRGGELLLPGEVRLEPGEEYSSPWLLGSWGEGLDEFSGRFHQALRARPTHPSRPRPVLLNVWEAVYFAHDPDKLVALAESAAEVGIERFVLDDGWFLGRRHDWAGLGDWYVDEAVWPGGLHRLVDRVHELGMEFGLWFEPEMVNLDSDLARAHPDWLLGTEHGPGPASRHQHVLDLANPDAYAHVLERMSSLIDEYRIAYLKWDHNRPLVDAGHAPGGTPGVHAQTRGDLPADGRAQGPAPRPGDRVLRRRRGPPGPRHHGARRPGVGLGLHRRPRAPAHGALDRPDAAPRADGHARRVRSGPHHAARPRPGLPGRDGPVGPHGRGVGPDRGARRTSGRHWRSGSRCTSGCDPCCTPVASSTRTWPTPRSPLDGVVAQDGSQALYKLAAVEHTLTWPPGRVTLPGLDPDRTYRVAALTPANADRLLGPSPDEAAAVAADGRRLGRWHRATTVPGWVRSDITLPGRVLAEVGIQAPLLGVDQLVLIHVAQVPVSSPDGPVRSVPDGEEQR